MRSYKSVKIDNNFPDRGVANFDNILNEDLKYELR